MNILKKNESISVSGMCVVFMLQRSIHFIFSLFFVRVIFSFIWIVWNKNSSSLFLDWKRRKIWSSILTTTTTTNEQQVTLVTLLLLLLCDKQSQVFVVFFLFLFAFHFISISIRFLSFFLFVCCVFHFEIENNNNKKRI